MTSEPTTKNAGPELNLVAIVEDERNDQFLCAVDLVTVGGERKRIFLKRSHFYDKRLLRSDLENAGAVTSLDLLSNSEAIDNLIAEGASADVWKLSAKFGWRDNNQFVLPYGVIGAGDSAVRVVCPDEAFDTKSSKLGRKGSLKRWQKQVAMPARYSSRFVLGICAGLAAALLKFSNQNSFGLQISGPSKCGKSTGLLAAASIAGIASEADLPNFRATPAALAELPADFNDILFPLNEMALSPGSHRARAEIMRQFSYGLAEGTGTTYSKHFSTKPALQWRTIALANSEDSAETLVSMAGSARADGEAIRWIDLPALRGDFKTIFDLAPPDIEDVVQWSKQKCLKIRRGVQTNHGVVLVKFLERILPQIDFVAEELSELSRQFSRDVTRPYDGHAAVHLAGCFGHIYAAGALAIELGILPWKRRLVLRCVKRCYIDARRAMRTSEDVQRSGLKTFLRKTENGKMVVVEKKGPKPNVGVLKKADGYVVRNGADVMIVVRAERFKAWFSDRRQPHLVVKWFQENGGLVLATGRKLKPGCGIVWAEKQKTWPDNTRVRSIVINLTQDVRDALPE